MDSMMPTEAPTLLLVDDDPATILILNKLLDDLPNQRFAASGEAALLLAKEATPDLILLDANLPGMTGFDVCEVLKADAALAHIPVIFVSGHHSPALKADALSLGAADYIIKPLSATRLRASVFAQLGASWNNGARMGQCNHQLACADMRTDLPAEILIVHNARGAPSVYEECFAGLGVVHAAGSGVDGLRLACGVAPAAIIIDDELEDVDALVLCAILTSRPVLQHVPIVFVTRTYDTRTIEQALTSGATHVIRKPLIRTSLRSSVQSLLASSSRKHAEEAAFREYTRAMRSFVFKRSQ
jgi:two-component system, cell cycle response regulator